MSGHPTHAFALTIQNSVMRRVSHVLRGRVQIALRHTVLMQMQAGAILKRAKTTLYRSAQYLAEHATRSRLQPLLQLLVWLFAMPVHAKLKQICARKPRNTQRKKKAVRPSGMDGHKGATPATPVATPCGRTNAAISVNATPYVRTCTKQTLTR
jgi:hypothetical protein